MSIIFSVDSDRFSTTSAPFSAYFKIITFIYRMNWVQIYVCRCNWLMEIIRIHVMSYFSINISPSRIRFSLPFWLWFLLLRSSLLSFVFCSFTFYCSFARVHACMCRMCERGTIPIKSNQKSIISYLYSYGAITIIIICSIKVQRRTIFFLFIHVKCIIIVTASVYWIYNINTRTVINIKIKFKTHSNQIKKTKQIAMMFFLWFYLIWSYIHSSRTHQYFFCSCFFFQK